MDENAYAVLDQRVQSRAGYLEDDMVRRWSNLSLTQEVLGELYEGLVQDGSVTPGELASDPAQYNEMCIRDRVKIIYGQESGLSITITEKGNTLSRMNIKFEQDGQ